MGLSYFHVCKECNEKYYTLSWHYSKNVLTMDVTFTFVVDHRQSIYFFACFKLLFYLLLLLQNGQTEYGLNISNLVLLPFYATIFQYIEFSSLYYKMIFFSRKTIWIGKDWSQLYNDRVTLLLHLKPRNHIDMMQNGFHIIDQRFLCEKYELLSAKLDVGNLVTTSYTCQYPDIYQNCSFISCACL